MNDRNAVTSYHWPLPAIPLDWTFGAPPT